MGYKHLSSEERFYIEARLASHDSINAIAAALKRSPSSISREVRANTDQDFGFYSARQAQILSDERCQKAVRKQSRLSQVSHSVVEFIHKSLTARTSPEQICGQIKLQFKTSISHQTLYRNIWKDRQDGGSLYENLRRRGKKAKESISRTAIKILNKCCISQRCEEANAKSKPGHWEIDTVFGLAQKSFLLTLVDRCSKFSVVRKIPNKEAETVRLALQEIMDETLLPFKTLTSDNGSEFAAHTKLTESHDIKFYFAHAYSSWERGLNEHTNGLIRDFLPKKTDFRLVDDAYIKSIENNLNNRPRKSLDFLTPKEAMVQHLSMVA